MRAHGLVGLILAPILASALVPSMATTERVDVLATFYPIAFIAEGLAQDDLTVGTFVPADADPRTYEPSAKDMLRASRARVVLYNGAGIEPWLTLLQRAAPDAIFVAVTQDVTFLEDEGFPEDAAGAARGVERFDPHVWLDPLRMKRMVNATARAFADLDPAHGVDYGRRADAMGRALDALHSRFDIGLAQCELRHVFVTAPAYGYVVVRYNLYQHGFSSLHPEAEPTPTRLIAEVRFARQIGARDIFEAPHADRGLAEAFARETGGKVLALDSIARDSVTTTANYFSRMDENLLALRANLGCR